MFIGTIPATPNKIKYIKTLFIIREIICTVLGDAVHHDGTHRVRQKRKLKSAGRNFAHRAECSRARTAKKGKGRTRVLQRQAKPKPGLQARTVKTDFGK